MDEGTIGLIIFFATAVASALLWHRFVASYLAAIAASTVTAVVAFQVMAYIHLGYLDPFYLIAVVTTTIFAAIVSLLVGLPFRSKRRTHVSDSKAL